jgi:hypothetical protein
MTFPGMWVYINGSGKEIKFPRTLTLYPIGGEGLKRDSLMLPLIIGWPAGRLWPPLIILPGSERAALIILTRPGRVINLAANPPERR